jgi:PilZ domain
MKQRRKLERNLCAEFITICWTDAEGNTRSELATLEDISATGACLQLEFPIPPDTEVSLQYPKGQYRGKIKYSAREQTGYIHGIEFHPPDRWSKADFEPSHLLELPLIRRK